MGVTSDEPRSLHDQELPDFSRCSISDQLHASKADNNFEVNCKQRSRRRSSHVNRQREDRTAFRGRGGRLSGADQSDAGTTYASSPVTPGPVGRQSTAPPHGAPLNTASHRARASTHQVQPQHHHQTNPSTLNGTTEQQNPVPLDFAFHPGEDTRPPSQDLPRRAQNRQSASTLASIESCVPDTPPKPLYAPPEVAVEDEDEDEEVNASAKRLVGVVGKGGGKEDDVFGPEVARERGEDEGS